MELDTATTLWRRALGNEAGEDRALLVLLHGLGSHAGDLFGLVPALPDALDVASLQAPLPWGPGRAWFELGFTPDGAPHYEAEQVREAARLVAGFVDEQRADYARIGLLGFSQGAATALAASAELAQAPDCLVLLSGLLPYGPEAPAPAGSAAVPTFVAIGDQDQVIGSQRAGDLERWVGTHTAAQVHHYPIGHHVSEPELADVRTFLATHLAR